MILAKGAACLPCRRDKKKCDGQKPACPRCLSLSKTCVYAPGIARRQTTIRFEKLEARALELELIVARLLLASKHDFSLLSLRLMRRIARLGSSDAPTSSDVIAWLPAHVYTRGENSCSDSRPSWHNQAFQPASHSNELLTSQPTGLEGLPFPLSNYLIDLFLPYQRFFFFSMDASYFLRCLSLPLSHPESIHPCLLNACYLGACVISKGGLSSLEAYFVRRTRHFLEQSLMYADRIPHFLWASVILGSHLLRLRRLEEAFAVISGAARMSSACGLVHEHNAGLADGDRLLPPPRNEQEADDRLKLARSVYIIDQSLAAVSGYPMTFPGDDSWGPSTNVLQLWGQQREEKKSGGGEVLELWQSERFKVSILKLIEQVNRFAFAVHGRSGSRASEEGYAALGYLTSSYVGIIPALVDVGRPGPPKPLTELEITVLSAHITLDGGGLLLHSLRAGEDPEARRQMFGYLRALVGALKWIKWYRPLYKIQAGLVPMILVMNATKIVANELGRFQVMAEVGQSIDYCQVLEVLLHYLEDSSLVYPRWANTHIALKDPLTNAVNSFSV